MNRDRQAQPGHFEYRYFVTDEVARRIRDFVGAYLELDSHSVGRPDFSYRVHNYYLDSDDWSVYWRMLDSGAKSPQLRVRFYGTEPSATSYAELKRRTNDLVEKHSVGLNRSAVNAILAGRFPARTDVAHIKEVRPLDTLERFCQFTSEFNARPRIHSTYLREAWVAAQGPRVRLTIDRNVQAALIREPGLRAELEGPVSIYGRMAVLELKFVERFPNWFQEMLGKFACRQAGPVKFVDSVRLLGGPAVSGSDTTFF